jgi:hypothetical protein
MRVVGETIHVPLGSSLGKKPECTELPEVCVGTRILNPTQNMILANLALVRHFLALITPSLF